jgi:hypothetical protein
MIKFTGENLIEFTEKFKTDLDCYTYLAGLKWAEGYKCPKCGHDKHTIRKANQARDCNRCHHIESPTANTLFHNVKFGIRKAFMIVFEMSATTKSISSSQMAKRYGISRTTAWTFMHKTRVAMKSSQSYPMEGDIQVDEFVFGGKENLKQGRSRDAKKKKIIGAVAVTKEGSVSRAYFKKIDDFSAISLKGIFEQHISKSANVYTDKWTGYKPLKATYNITAKYSDAGQGMKQFHTIVHQLKSWLRSVYSWVHAEHIEKYLDEYSFRINRSIYKETIFHNLILRMVNGNAITYQTIKISN